jgi:hypothetical protein
VESVYEFVTGLDWTSQFMPFLTLALFPVLYAAAVITIKWLGVPVSPLFRSRGFYVAAGFGVLGAVVYEVSLLSYLAPPVFSSSRPHIALAGLDHTNDRVRNEVVGLIDGCLAQRSELTAGGEVRFVNKTLPGDPIQRLGAVDELVAKSSADAVVEIVPVRRAQELDVVVPMASPLHNSRRGVRLGVLSEEPQQSPPVIDCLRLAASVELGYAERLIAGNQCAPAKEDLRSLLASVAAESDYRPEIDQAFEKAEGCLTVAEWASSPSLFPDPSFQTCEGLARDSLRFYGTPGPDRYANVQNSFSLADTASILRAPRLTVGTS